MKSRIPETDLGIQGEFTVAAFDQMQRGMRDRGYIQTRALLACGPLQGCALEIGPGPGYLGLEWLKHTQGTRLTGLDISTDMLAVARRNAQEYGLDQRVEYRSGTGDDLPFPLKSFQRLIRGQLAFLQFHFGHSHSPPSTQTAIRCGTPRLTLPSAVPASRHRPQSQYRVWP